MLSAENIIALVFAYLIGSVPTSVWIGQLFYKIDVREYGSGNAGATNTFRTLGAKAGIPVLVIDVLKGWLAVNLIYFFGDNFSHIQEVNFKLALGVGALIGHIFPVYAGFRGGKGIATLLGMMIAIYVEAALLAMLIFLIVFILTRYVSLSSMIAAVGFPVIVIVGFQTTIPSLVIFSLFIAIMVLITHQKNIERLLRNEESRAKFSLIRKKNHEEDDEIDDDDD